MKPDFNLLDAVALLKDIPEKKLLKGQVGTIVEILDTNVFEIEFSDKKGQTLVSIAIEKNDLLLLKYELTAA
ncbi:MAG: DUF4926 domain-containing protein [Bacteroidia bacterium]|nr:DUF4926 domain-containing protein [Bacteroidia bacterium]